MESFKKINQQEGKNRSVAYNDEIKKLTEESPGLFSVVLKILPLLEKEGEHSSIEKDGLKITFFQKRNWSNNFKIEMTSKTFFLRKELGRGTSFKSIKAYQEAERRFEGSPDVGFIDYQLGYTDKYGNDYFIAKWENFPVMGDYLGQNEISDNERELIGKKLGHVYDTLSDFKDVTTDNMFYDPIRKKIILFDLQIKEHGSDECSVE